MTVFFFISQANTFIMPSFLVIISRELNLYDYFVMKIFEEQCL